jgi:hypothetical protein
LQVVVKPCQGSRLGHEHASPVGPAFLLLFGGDIATFAAIEKEPNVPLNLTANEARVIGCLIEKSVVTPDQYPLTLQIRMSRDRGCK